MGVSLRQDLTRSAKDLADDIFDKEGKASAKVLALLVSFLSTVNFWLS